ncbi:hypothetical protein GYMLUDRAFT_34872 [Collybiopsis luxurians FD-317 M1]|nr:hypothetical protein GYMLUDRAFT_34872 [Collybiopsis luxurians FD-317 M1]
MQTSMESISGVDRPTSAPPPAEESRIGELRPSPLVTSVSASNSTVSSPAFPTRSSLQPNSKTKGLQLGASKVPSSVSAAAILAEQLAMEAAAEDGEGSNPWGDDDLMDVNADDGDWSAFETAPPPVISTSAVVAPKPVPAQPSNGFTTSNLASKTRTPMPRAPSKTSSTMSPPPSTNDWDTPDDNWDAPAEAPRSSITTAAPISTSNLTKEERAAEMARRKEERKQRIAMLKEQKKNASRS